MFEWDEYYVGYKECDTMAIRLIIEGNSVYEIDETCEPLRRKGARQMENGAGQNRCDREFETEKAFEKIENSLSDRI